MEPVTPDSTRLRPLQANNIDHIIRSYGGSTIAVDMEPRHMRKSKKPEVPSEYFEYLIRKNGQMRLEAIFYRECFRDAEKFKDKIARLSQDLLTQCIIGLLDNAAFEEVKDICQSVSDAVDVFDEDQRNALDAFVAPYKTSMRVRRTGMSLDESI